MKDRTLSEVGTSLKDGLAHAKSPMAALAATYNHAPSGSAGAVVRSFLSDKAMEIMLTELPKLSACVKLGPAMNTTEIPSIPETYAQALEYGEQHAPKEFARISETEKDIGRELGEVLDRCVRRILLTDTVANRMAVLTLLQLHAKTVATLSEIALTPEQQKDLDNHGELDS